MVEAGRRFDFKRCLGAGGFGEVYLASMTSASGVETEVAVKMLHEGLDPRSQAVQRLRDEGRLLGTLNHPSVLKVHDLVLLDGRVALVMEYVPGLDLEQCVELAQPIGLRAGLEVIGRVADALHTAYTSDGPDGQPLRLVHRDIKPPNVRIGQHGEVKVLDFGIAKAADARREAKTQTSVMIGSPWYMAPERFDGKNDGAPADVYALGCSLYEVAARGGRLFSELSSREHFLLALDPAAHDAHVREHLRPLDIPGDVRWLLDRMLAYDALERPTTHEVAEQVGREHGRVVRLDLVDDLRGVARHDRRVGVRVGIRVRVGIGVRVR
ncbi:MAG: serine/threonine protein kinase, partial [Myxococcales bacterium]|nr:serine/threonine protein kinase [Myxococcales bacterium]